MLRPLLIFMFLLFLLFHSGAVYSQNNSKEYLQKGIKCEREGMIDAAIKEYEKALSVDQDYSDALFNLGIIYLRKEQFENAIKYLEHIVTLNSSDGETCYNLAVAYYGLGEINKAIEYNDKSLKLGYPGTVEFNGWLGPYKHKEIDFEYTSTFVEQKSKLIVKIHGNPQGDKVLINDILAKLEVFEGDSRKGMFKSIAVECIKREKYGKVSIEKWTVTSSNNSQNQYIIKFNPSPQGGTDILIEEFKKDSD